MAHRIEAIVDPSLLAWARESIGFSTAVAAKKIHVEEGKLTDWELGKSRPTIKQLRTAANAYKRPLAVFFLSEPPKEDVVPHDFRRLPSDQPAKRSPALMVELRKAHRRRELAVELSSLIGEAIENRVDRFVDVSHPEKVAQRVRGKSSISLQDQFRWRDEYDALNAWKSYLEDQGVLVFQFSRVQVSEVRGFSLSRREYPVIAVNGKDSPKGRIFTLLHEYAHLMLDKGGMCDLRQGRVRGENSRIEQFCNHFAGAFLVPRDSLLSETLVSRNPKMGWTDEDLHTLALKYRVSTEVILRRLLVLDRTTNQFYRQKREELQALSQPAKSGPVHQAKQAIIMNGRRFTGLVLRAYQDAAITSREVADYLGVRLKHLHEIESQL